jgi:hypothetical protein
LRPPVCSEFVRRISGTSRVEDVMTPEVLVDTPELLMQSAREGRLPKHALASLLTPESRQAFLAACAEIEARFTDACATSGDPCLESGCSCEGEVCLQPLLRAGSDYLSACGAEWATLFAVDGNRDMAWRVTAGLA